MVPYAVITITPISGRSALSRRTTWYAVHARQALVGERQVDVLALEEIQRLLAAPRGQDLEALELESAPQRAEKDLVILDDQHASLHPALLSEGRSSLASPARAPR